MKFIYLLYGNRALSFVFQLWKFHVFSLNCVELFLVEDTHHRQIILSSVYDF